MVDLELLIAKKRLEDSGKYKVFKKVREYPTKEPNVLIDTRVAIVDLETTGLDHRTCEIIEIGVIVFEYYSNKFDKVVFTYNELQEPKNRINENITQITGITNEDVKGKKIDWKLVEDALSQCKLVVCHNAAFDRKFLERQTPITKTIEQLNFACTKNDIDWSAKGYGANKLDYLNWAKGYFYDAHRAINDCWATLNLINTEDDGLKQLLDSVSGINYFLYAVDAPFDKKDKLKSNGYYWNDGSNGNPKAWFKKLKPSADIEVEYIWLEKEIYGYRSPKVFQSEEVNSCDRYSERAK